MGREGKSQERCWGVETGEARRGEGDRVSLRLDDCSCQDEWEGVKSVRTAMILPCWSSFMYCLHHTSGQGTIREGQPSTRLTEGGESTGKAHLIQKDGMSMVGVETGRHGAEAGRRDGRWRAKRARR